MHEKRETEQKRGEEQTAMEDETTKNLWAKRLAELVAPERRQKRNAERADRQSKQLL